MRVHPKYFVPNGFTALSMLFGLASAATSASAYIDHLNGKDSTEQFALAAWMICWGVLLDKLDGTSARLMKASSAFGVQFDSFADFVVFGIAPAALIYFRVSALDIPFNKPLLLIGVGFFVVATATRLARFNISEPPGGDQMFYGIPTTLCGAFVAASFLVWSKYDLPITYLKAYPGLLVFAGIAMVSNVKLPKLKPRKNKLFNLFQAINIVAAYACTAMMIFPEYLGGLVVIYLVFGLSYYILFPPVIEAAAAEEQAAAEEAAEA